VKVTFVVPCYQQGDTISRTLYSIRVQTVPVHEIIVVNDGSDERHTEMITTACFDWTARHVQVANRGLPSARNVGLMLATGDAFVPLDSDDWIEDTYIEKMLPLLAHADVVVPGLREHGQRTGVYHAGFDRPLADVTLSLMWHDFNRTFYASMFRTQLLREVGGWNGRMTRGMEDYDLALDLMLRGARYVACPHIVFNYTTSPDGMLAETMRDHVEWNRQEMARHHPGLADVPPLR
jgi:glycosyltransferase involved in cell wall biosynthesis